jgi:hypothetical protein
MASMRFLLRPAWRVEDKPVLQLAALGRRIPNSFETKIPSLRTEMFRSCKPVYIEFVGYGLAALVP